MATQAGIILGTAAYMSPEQAKGFPADHRSDVFSFGVVLYEMLTGRQPFQGETAPDILASVLVREPDLHALPPDLNPRLPELVRRCLEKNPKRRWQAMGDVRAEIENDRGGAATLPVGRAAAAKPALEARDSPSPSHRPRVALGASVWTSDRQPSVAPSLDSRWPPANSGLTGPGRHRSPSPPTARIVYVANRRCIFDRCPSSTRTDSGHRRRTKLTTGVFAGRQSVAFFAQSDALKESRSAVGPRSRCVRARIPLV